MACAGIHPQHPQRGAQIQELRGQAALQRGRATGAAGQNRGGAPLAGLAAGRIPARQGQLPAGVDEAEVEQAPVEGQRRGGGAGEGGVGGAEVGPAAPAVAPITALAEPERGISRAHALHDRIQGAAHRHDARGGAGEADAAGTGPHRDPRQGGQTLLDVGPDRGLQTEAGGGRKLVGGAPEQHARGAAGAEIASSGGAQIAIEEQGEIIKSIAIDVAGSQHLGAVDHREAVRPGSAAGQGRAAVLTEEQLHRGGDGPRQDRDRIPEPVAVDIPHRLQRRRQRAGLIGQHHAPVGGHQAQLHVAVAGQGLGAPGDRGAAVGARTQGDVGDAIAVDIPCTEAALARVARLAGSQQAEDRHSNAAAIGQSQPADGALCHAAGGGAFGGLVDITARQQLVAAEQHIAPLRSGGIAGLNQQIAIAILVDIAQAEQAVGETIGAGRSVQDGAAGQIGEVLIAAQVEGADGAGLGALQCREAEAGVHQIERP